MTTVTEKKTYTTDSDMSSSDAEFSVSHSRPKPITQRHLSSSSLSSSSSTKKSRRRLSEQTTDLVPQTFQVARTTTTKSVQGPDGESVQETETVQTEKKDDNGLKLRLVLNLDIEIELKAKIHGDLTLALL
ncbi:hypothetical protein BDW74DRAFT_181764 [Aspergillus multicolor]|uniref:uncharacterized protein n=1 Tax=Aspergillus multicolor TaxID=41759 RepID=UPI003CCDDBA5